MDIPKILQQRGINFVLVEKQGKKPFQLEWQKKKIEFDNQELLQHINNGGNYGVMGGGEKNLIIIDFDDIILQEQIVPKLPKTFTVKTGTNKLHKYFTTDKPECFKIFNEHTETLADIQGEGKQVIGAGSIHPNGSKYEVVDDCEIAFLPIAEIKALLMPFDKKKKKKKPIEKIRESIEDDFIDKLKNAVSIEDVLSHYGVDTSRNPTSCPFHDSKGGKCLGFNDHTAHCFHCDESWNIFSFVKEYKNCGSKEAIDELASIAGLTQELEDSRKEYGRRQYAIQEASKVFTPRGQGQVFTSIQPLFYDKYSLWWLWNLKETKWEIVDEVDILNMIADSTGEDVITPKNRTLILNSLKQEGRKKVPIPMKSTWIQFKDKIMDIETGETFNAGPEYFATNPLPWRLHPEKIEATPNMDRIFEEWVGKENVKQLYEILAYCMMPDYPINRLFCFIGSGMNGKSKFLELLRNFVGGNNCCTTELDTLLTSRFEITRLHKKLVCMMGETNFNEMSKTSILKKLTGGDLIGFEYKNKNPFDEKNYAKIIIATNNLPTTTDKTEGFYRRWMIIDFPNKFSEAKDILAEIPEEEYESLALKCSVILKDLLKQRSFTNEGSVEERKEKYESKSNFIETFLREATIEDVNGYITSADFFKRFSAWCKENRHREMSETSVGIAMKKAGIEQEKRYFQWLYDGKGGQLRCWTGLKWVN